MKPKQDDSEWEFKNYKCTNLAHDMLCEPTDSDIEKKEEDNISGNRLINLKILTTNIDNFLLCQQYAQEKAVLMKLEEERDQEK